jgi:ABC-type transport system involved in multi-copper enzyme maturation permease subunit
MKSSLAIAGIVIKELIRRKDFYVLFVLTAIITLALGSAGFMKDDKAVRSIKEIVLLLIWIASLVIAVTTTARQIPQERESRTIFPLLAKPVSRGQVLVGKFLGCWLASLLSLAVFYAFFIVVCGTKEHHWPLPQYFQAFWMHGIMLGVVVALTLLGSVVFAAPSSTNTITMVIVLGILILGQHLNKVALTMSGVSGTILSAIYFAIPHLEFYDLRDLIIHNWPLVGWQWIGLATLYGAAYGGAFLVLAWLKFRRMALN